MISTAHLQRQRFSYSSPPQLFFFFHWQTNDERWWVRPIRYFKYRQFFVGRLKNCEWSNGIFASYSTNVPILTNLVNRCFNFVQFFAFFQKIPTMKSSFSNNRLLLTNVTKCCNSRLYNEDKEFQVKKLE